MFTTDIYAMHGKRIVDRLQKAVTNMYFTKYIQPFPMQVSSTIRNKHHSHRVNDCILRETIIVFTQPGRTLPGHFKNKNIF